MTLRQHYKMHSRKSIKPYKVLCFLMFLVMITVFQTFSRYSNGRGIGGKAQTARWELKINETYISSSTTQLGSPVQLVNSSDGTNNIDVGDVCYFDLLVDSEKTQVAVAYQISVNTLDANSTLPAGTSILRYEKYNGQTLSLISTTNVNSTAVTISDRVNLVNDDELTKNQSIKYRIYCQMPAYADLVKDSSIGVVPQIEARQLLSNE